jgi:hypothetical protein
LTDWGAVKGKISEILKEIRGNQYATAAISTALSEIPIPFLGTFLAKVFDSAIGSDQEKYNEIINLLENLQKMRETDLESLTDAIAATRQQMERDSSTLKKLVLQTNLIVEQLYRIERGQEKIGIGNTKILQAVQTVIEREGMATTELINKMDYLETTIVSNFENSNPIVKKFDFSIDAERLLFYLGLQEHLLESGRIFFNQAVISDKLVDSLRSRGNIIEAGEGKDEVLCKFYDVLNRDEREMFNFLRKTLKDVWKFNSHSKDLIMTNRECLTEIPEFLKLVEHYSWWQAKYRLLRNNPHVCLIFVGVRQKKRFPKEIDDLVSKKISELRKGTVLELSEFQ